MAPLYVTVGAGYPVVVAADCAHTLAHHLAELGLRGRVHIVADQQLTALAHSLAATCGAQSTVLLLAGGEASKDVATLMRIYDHLLQQRVEQIGRAHV